jgi:hypothetical protein
MVSRVLGMIFAQSFAVEAERYTLRGEKLRFACHSERSEESLFPHTPAQRFFTALCSVQNAPPLCWEYQSAVRARGQYSKSSC